LAEVFRKGTPEPAAKATRDMNGVDAGNPGDRAKRQLFVVGVMDKFEHSGEPIGLPRTVAVPRVKTQQLDGKIFRRFTTCVKKVIQTQP